VAKILVVGRSSSGWRWRGCGSGRQHCPSERPGRVSAKETRELLNTFVTITVVAQDEARKKHIAEALPSSLTFSRSSTLTRRIQNSLA